MKVLVKKKMKKKEEAKARTAKAETATRAVTVVKVGDDRAVRGVGWRR